VPSPQTKLLAWTPERARDLAAWIERGQELGLDLRGYDGKTSASAAVGEALKRAAACRCEEHNVAAVVGRDFDEPANPLRALREAAGLSQAQAAARLGMTRGAWANAEKAARATPAMVERARAGLR
jgi:DNA-binding transcriptional regulator YiaG